MRSNDGTGHIESKLRSVQCRKFQKDVVHIFVVLNSAFNRKACCYGRERVITMVLQLTIDTELNFGAYFVDFLVFVKTVFFF